MMNFFKRWKRNSSKSTDQKPVAQFNLKVYADKLELDFKGDEVKVGGALVTLMLRHPQFSEGANHKRRIEKLGKLDGSIK